MVAFLYRMGETIPGDVVSSAFDFTPDTDFFDPTLPIPAYGMPVKLNATGTGIAPITVGDVTAAVWGILMRPFPMQQPTAAGNYGQQQLTDATTPPTKGVANVLRRGKIGVNVNSATRSGIIKGGPVYIWTAVASAGHIQGQFEGSTPGGSGFLLVGATYDGPPDSNGNTVVNFNM